jgi:hypothetical protein
MKKRYLNFGTAVFLLLMVQFGCAKEEPSPNDPSNPSTTGTVSFGDFRWTPEGGNVIIADSARFIPAFTNIVAYKNGSTIDIVLSSLSVGTYSISSSQGNALEYYNGTTYNGVSGNVKITINSGSKLSGSFTSSLTGGTIKSINGQFTEIPTL